MSIRVVFYNRSNIAYTIFIIDPINLCILWFWIGQKFGFDARNAAVTDEQGAEIDSIDVIRDNDKLFIVEDPNYIM